jgi:hypothetical protein
MAHGAIQVGVAHVHGMGALKVGPSRMATPMEVIHTVTIQMDAIRTAVIPLVEIH